jgi:hypothetical protein
VDSVSVTMATTTPNCTIRYTTNGTDPSPTAGTVYSGPVTLTSTTTLKAIAYGTGVTASTITSQDYVITPSGGGTNPVYTHAGPTTFNGTSTYISGGTSNGSASSLTVAFFATPAKLANMSAADKLPLTGTAGWSVKLRSNGDLWFRVGSEGTKSDTVVTGVYSANTKVHLACTFTGGTARVYVNGVLRGTTTGVTYSVANTTTDLRLGIPSVAATSNIYQGVLENVRVYHQALTAAEIAALATPADDAVWRHDGPTTFDGVDDYVQDSASYGSASSLTVAFFATPSRLAAMGPVDKLPLTGTAGWSVKLRSNGDLWFRIGSEGTKADAIATGVYSANARVHIACTFSGGTARIYVNGALRTTLTGISYAVANSTTPLRLGIPSAAATTNTYAGVLEKVRIYNRVLTASEITTLSQQ